MDLDKFLSKHIFSMNFLNWSYMIHTSILPGRETRKGKPIGPETEKDVDRNMTGNKQLLGSPMQRVS